MKRPLFLFSISMVIGIAVANFSDSYLFALVVFFVCAIIGMLLYRKIGLSLFIFIGVMLFYLIGSFEYLYTNHLYLNRFIGFEGTQVTVVGNVDSEREIRETKVLYVIRTEKIITSDGSKNVKGKILFTTLKDKNANIYDYGTEIKINGQLSTPKGKRNPGGFDYRGYLARSGISATIFAKGNNVSIGESKDINFLVKLGLDVRNNIMHVIDKSLPREQAGLLNGMLIGYKDELDKDVQEAFSNAGLSHIMAVSGMNVAFIVFPLVFLFKRLGLRQRITNVIIILVLVMFVFTTGFSPSVVRAVIMAVIVLLGQIIMRESDVLTSISAAAILLLVFYPGTLFDVGFQLSFAATLSLILLYKTIKKALSFKWMPKFMVELLAVTISAQLGVIPITALYFNKISLISVFTNILVVPLTGIITILGFVMALIGQVSIPLSQLIGYINCTFLTFILYITKITAALPYAVLKIITPHMPLLILYYVVLLFFLWYKPKYSAKVNPKVAVVISGLVVVVVCIYLMLPRGLEVVFIDVGEGDSTFIRTSSGMTVLIDGGGANSMLNPDANIGETTVIPFLLDYGVSKLDLVIATHGHDDHIQGLIPVLEEFDVDNFIIPDTTQQKELKKLIDISDTRGIKVKACQKGDVIKLDNQTYFDVLYPEEDIEISKSALNNSSLVLKLYYKKISMLFTGDIEEDVEKMLINEKTYLDSDVLKVAHHGSVSSTTEDFLKLISPSAAVISVGKNTFGHPSPLALDRLIGSGVRVFRTDECGAIILTTDGETIKVQKTINE